MKLWREPLVHFVFIGAAIYLAYNFTFVQHQGRYLFTALPPERYVVVVPQTGPITNATQTADPNSDGVPCTDPCATGCDGSATDSPAPTSGFGAGSVVASSTSSLGSESPIDVFSKSAIAGSLTAEVSRSGVAGSSVTTS